MCVCVCVFVQVWVGGGWVVGNVDDRITDIAVPGKCSK